MEIYEALVNSKKHTAFTGAKATGAARNGGRFTAWDGYITGIHRELIPERKIIQEWVTTEWPKGYPPSQVAWIFTPRKDGTMVMLIHSEVPAAQYESYRLGWIDHYWNPLKENFNKPSKSAGKPAPKKSSPKIREKRTARGAV